MSIGSEIRDKRPLEELASARPAGFSSNVIPYLLSFADGIVILLSSLAGGIGYHMLAGNPIPSIPPYCAVGLLASLIHILRMNGKGYYDFPDSAKPRVELSEILVCWVTTALLLALFRIPVQGRRRLFPRLIHHILLPCACWPARSAQGHKARSDRGRIAGAIGRRDTVLVGEFNEIAALGPQDLLAFCRRDRNQPFYPESGRRSLRALID